MVAFWGFGLAEKMMPQEEISQIMDVPKKIVPESVKSAVLSPASADVEPKVAQKSAPEKKQAAVDTSAEPASNLELLEKKEFRISLSGTYYAGSPSTSKPALLDVTVRPISGSNLENFEVIEAKMAFDSLRVSLKNPSVVIKGTEVVMTFTSDAVGPFVVRGTLDDPMLSDKNNKQALVVKNQVFYLGQKDIPYRVDMTGTLSGL